MSDGLNARDYQLSSFDGIRDSFISGYKKVLLWLATGGGKTFIFCEVAKRTIKGKRKDGSQKRVAIVVRGRKLVDQASKRLFREGTPHGVHMAGHWNYRPNELVQVCSIDTLRARDIMLDVDLLIIDEAHLFTSVGDKEYLAKYKCFVLAVTATPYCSEGLRHLADTMVKPTSMLDLIANGYLVPFRYFGVGQPDLSEVKISKSSGDYVSDQLANAMMDGDISGKIVDTWMERGQGLKTLIFAVNIKHSKSLVERFNSAGARFEHCDAETPDNERQAIIDRLERGEIDGISNVGIFCTGVDIPDLKYIALARPTKSLNLYIQQAGRGTRVSKGKDWCILVDHAGLIKEHGLPTDEPDVDLDGVKKYSTEKQSKSCKLCFVVFRGPHCPECGPQEHQERTVEIIESNHKIIEISVESDPIKRMHKELLKDAKKTGKKPMWVSYKMIDYFGIEKARPYLTDAFIDRYEQKMLNAFSGSRFKAIGMG